MIIIINNTSNKRDERVSAFLFRRRRERASEREGRESSFFNLSSSLLLSIEHFTCSCLRCVCVCGGQILFPVNFSGFSPISTLSPFGAHAVRFISSASKENREAFFTIYINLIIFNLLLRLHAARSEPTRSSSSSSSSLGYIPFLPILSKPFFSSLLLRLLFVVSVENLSTVLARSSGSASVCVCVCVIDCQRLLGLDVSKKFCLLMLKENQHTQAAKSN